MYQSTHLFLRVDWQTFTTLITSFTVRRNLCIRAATRRAEDEFGEGEVDQEEDQEEDQEVDQEEDQEEDRQEDQEEDQEKDRQEDQEVNQQEEEERSMVNIHDCLTLAAVVCQVVPAPQSPEGRRPVCIQSLFIL